MKKAVLRLTTALALSCGVMAGAALANGKVVLYCPAPGDWCQNVANDFTRETGIGVDVLRKSAGEILAQMRAESARPKGDLWWGGISDSHFAAAAEGLTEPYDYDKLNELAPWSQALYKASNKYAIGTYGITLGVGYNPEVLAKKKVAAPACWADLVKPEYKGEVQLPNPNSSGTAYQMIAALITLMGEEKAFDYQKTLHRNVTSYNRSGVAPGKAVARGETGIGINYLQDMLVEQRAGFPIKIVTPCEGTVIGVDAMSLIKGGPNPENARKLYRWLLTVNGQETSIRSGLLHMPAHINAKQPSDDPALKAAKVVDYDFKKYGASDERKRILARWEKDINSLPR